MVAYSFQPRFAEPILEGTKGGTIRGRRKRHARPGELIQLYTGMRSANCRLITRKRCGAVEPITLVLGATPRVIIGGVDRGSSGRALMAFARFDGFPGWFELVNFWQLEHAETERFDGWHIRWLELPQILKPKGEAG